MAVKLAIANSKGGVGKPTCAMMISEGLALYNGWRVLAIDLDPQASLTSMLLSSQGAYDAADRHRTMADLLLALSARRALSLGSYLTPKASDIIELRDATDRRRVDLVASNSELQASYWTLARTIQVTNPNTRVDIVLANALAIELDRLDRSYDIVIFDCPAGTLPLGTAALRLSDYVISPTLLDEISLRALAKFVSDVLNEDLEVLSNLKGFTVLPTKVVGNNPDQRLRLEHIRAGIYGLNALPKALGQSVDIERATTRLRANSFRSARQKYDGALDDFKELSVAVTNLISKKKRGTS